MEIISRKLTKYLHIPFDLFATGIKLNLKHNKS